MWTTPHNQRLKELKNVNYTPQPKKPGATELQLHHTVALVT